LEYFSSKISDLTHLQTAILGDPDSALPKEGAKWKRLLP
jgi:hypothetical protein